MPLARGTGRIKQIARERMVFGGLENIAARIKTQIRAGRLSGLRLL